MTIMTFFSCLGGDFFMELGTILGIAGAFGSLIFCIALTGNGLGPYLDLPSLVEVIVGSYFATMVSAKLPTALGIFSTMGRAFKTRSFHEADIIKQMMSLSEKTRKEGLLALEEVIRDLDNKFMKKGLSLAVDGTDGAIIQELMEIEISKMQERHLKKVAILFQWAMVAPAVGMLGTVIGLVAMMKNLADKDSVGPNMAMALITTLYGAIVAHFFCTPMGVKLKEQDMDEAASMEMIIEGVLSIQAGDNPRILAMKLLAYLPPAESEKLEVELLGKD
jgi:chemotaxis protein MotA